VFRTFKAKAILLPAVVLWAPASRGRRQAFSSIPSVVFHPRNPHDVEDDDDTREQIEAAITNSGVDAGGWGDGSLCAYHTEQVAKDD